MSTQLRRHTSGMSTEYIGSTHYEGFDVCEYREQVYAELLSAPGDVNFWCDTLENALNFIDEYWMETL